VAVGAGGVGVGLGVVLAVGVVLLVGITKLVGAIEAVGWTVAVAVDGAGVRLGEPDPPCKALPPLSTGVLVTNVTPLNGRGVIVGVGITNGVTATAGVGST
jgi:hypothetical protein